MQPVFCILNLVRIVVEAEERCKEVVSVVDLDVFSMFQLRGNQCLDFAIKPSIEIEELGLRAANCFAVNLELCLNQRKPGVLSQRCTGELVRVWKA